MRHTLILPFLLTPLLAACGHQRPGVNSSVAIPATQIRATEFGVSSRPSTAEPSAFARRARPGAISSDIQMQCQRPELAAAAAAQGPSASTDFLVLSGGSQHGAFGAGFFLGLQEKGTLPVEPNVVTGVSTGSLQSTFLFLARQPVTGDRTYGWMGGIATQPGPGLDPLKPGRSNIEDLALAYSIRREGDILNVYNGEGIGLLVNGAKGSLNPLRRRLMDLISPNTIREIAVQACRGRKLFVGVTDVDDGYGYALDMTALALRAFDGNATPALMTLVRTAYVDGLIASSSVPVGAKPVTLRMRDFDSPLDTQHRFNLFVDGGARFGVFLKEIKDAQALATATKAAQPASAAATPDSNVTLIVNTRLAMGPWDKDEEDLRRPTGKWTLVSLGLRAVNILENQVYQLSVANVLSQADRLRMAYLSNQDIAGGEKPDDHSYRGKSCGAWYSEDRAKLKPVEFYPSYMACLIDYGRQRGLRGEWNRAM